MKHAPISKERSPWENEKALIIDGYRLATFSRRVSDGVLYAMVAQEPPGWHMSISFRNHKGVLSRYPRWDEIMHAREFMLPDDVGFVMHLPPADEYVALHDTTFHLHEHPSH